MGEVISIDPHGRTPERQETVADLFVPEVVLPSQVPSGARRDSEACPEKALMLAVLEDGIRCFQGGSALRGETSSKIQIDARKWVSAVDYDWPYSFVNVCEALGIDPIGLCQGLFAWERRQVAAIAAHATSPAERKIYRLHLRTKRKAYVRLNR